MALIRTLLRILTIGRAPQSFLDAGWVRLLLDLAPSAYKQLVALVLLDVSPHYFMPENRGESSFTGYLKSEFERNRESRKEIVDQILKEHVPKNGTVMDYGCGPGFLAYQVAPLTKQTFAVDISRGALACAEILNKRANIDYIPAQEMERVPDESLDFVYSFAVIQHVTDDVFRDILTNVYTKLKPNGEIFLDVIVDDPTLPTEAEWRNKESIKEKARFKFGLNIFTRSSSQVVKQAERAGFVDVDLLDTSKLVEYHFDDICDQSILIGRKP